MRKLLVAAWFVVACGGGAKKEGTTPTSDLPGPVKRTLEEQAQGAPIEGVEQEKEGGVDVYEGHWHKDGKLIEVTVKWDGTLVEREEEIAAADVPEPARIAASGKLGGAQPAKWVKLQDGTFEAEGSVDGKETDVKVDATGKVLDTETDSAEPDDKD